MSSVVITGPPGSGKTTVSRLLAERSARGVHLDADRFWHMIVSGYVNPWTPESSTQNVTVIAAVAAAAVEYAAGGYDVYVDMILGPWHLDSFTQPHLEAGITVSYVLLRPSLETALARATGRGEPGLADDEPIRHMHDQFSTLDGFEPHIVDNGELDARETVDLIVKRLARGDYLLPARSERA